MLQMQLFLHFETDTRFTLVFGPDVWKQCMSIALKVFPLSRAHYFISFSHNFFFQNKFMMHAILMIAAAHMSFQHPSNEQFRTAELEHLAAATTGLRQNLSPTLDTEQLDAVFPVCVLVYNQLWTSIEDLVGAAAAAAAADDDLLTSIFEDSLIHLGAGFKTYVTGADAIVSGRLSPWFAPVVAYSPRIELLKFLESSELPLGAKMPQDFEHDFSDEFLHIWPEGVGQNAHHYAPYMTECKRLTIVLSALDVGSRGIDIRSLDDGIVRYLFTWPMLMSCEIMELMKEGSAKCVLLLLWHYYTIVKASPARKYWWAQRRMNFMVKVLGSRLRDEGVEPRGMLPRHVDE